MLCVTACVSVCPRSQHWVAGLSWLAGDALLAAVTKEGSVALLSALAGPVPLLVAGSEASGQPSHFLTLHRLLPADRSVTGALLRSDTDRHSR